MPFQASKLDLPYKYPSSSSSSSISSLVFDHPSNSLLLSFSDSSHLLFPSFSPSSSPPSPPPTPIPPSSTAVSFLRLLPSNTLLFFAASPLKTALALRAWILRANPPRFESVRLSYKRRSPAVLALAHGFGVRVAGAVNYFVVHSPAAGQIWVMGVRMEGGFGAGLVKCAVVDCDLPIYAVGVSAGFLVLGEIGGVRVFSVRGLVKGGRKRGFLNGVVIGGASSAGFEGAAEGEGDRNHASGKVWAILSVFFLC